MKHPKLKILTIVGARPQFIKAAGFSRYIRTFQEEHISEILVHTGQHYDENMSDVFFESLSIPTPHYHLGISGGTHGAMTGQMLEALEKVMIDEKPDWVLVYGDTNSTLAGALAAAKLHIPIAHVEAGLRSFNRRMPEEVNRVLCDHVSTLLFCPTETAVQNLANEGIEKGVFLVGDIMYDVALYFQTLARDESTILKTLQLTPKKFALVTCHRAENTDDLNRLQQILKALSLIAEKLPVVFPMHPRTRDVIAKNDLLPLIENISVIEPLPYLDMVLLSESASVILTDSGGLQKEAFFYRVPCVTLRDETEWIETVSLGWNTLVGSDTDAIVSQCFQEKVGEEGHSPYGDGCSAQKMTSILLDGSHFFTERQVIPLNDYFSSGVSS